jgi:hypothetical protein
MNTAKSILAGLLVLAALPGCSSSDAGDAPQKCDEMLTLFCSSVTSCEISGGLREASTEASANAGCTEDLAKKVNCSRVRRVSAQYDDCMNTLADPPCEAINQAITAGESIGLPQECDGVLLLN